MTDTQRSADVDTARAAVLRAAMVDAMTAEGDLPDRRWRAAFAAVPRHLLVPDYYQGADRLHGPDEAETWLSLVYSDTTLITQRGPNAVTSSGTMPGLLAAMLHAVDVRDGHRVLQVATGTGYTTALLCERLGSALVSSIEIDPDLSAAARDRLYMCGYTPNLATGDGREGLPENAPYDRVIVTFGVHCIPPAWIDQTRPGGIVVAPVVSGLVRLTVTGPGHAEGRFVGAGYFIQHRADTPSGAACPVPLAEAPQWGSRMSKLPSSTYYDTDFRFFLDLTEPGLTPAFRDNPLDLTLIASDGSHAHINPDGLVTQTGPCRVWDLIEDVHHEWHRLGRPPRERFGLTMTSDGQTVWLDSATSDHCWMLPPGQGVTMRGT